MRVAVEDTIQGIENLIYLNIGNMRLTHEEGEALISSLEMGIQEVMLSSYPDSDTDTVSEASVKELDSYLHSGCCPRARASEGALSVLSA